MNEREGKGRLKLKKEWRQWGVQKRGWKRVREKEMKVGREEKDR